MKDFNDVALKWIQSNIEDIKSAKGNQEMIDGILKKFKTEMGPKYSSPSSGEYNSDAQSLNTMMTGMESGGQVTHTAENLELQEAYRAIKTLKSELNEVNLLNAKLLYTNRIFKSKNLTEGQKVKVLSTFDKASNVNEVKLVYETLNGSFNTKKKSINENLGSASRSVGTTRTTKAPIIEDVAYKRMRELAFYNVKH